MLRIDRPTTSFRKALNESFGLGKVCQEKQGAEYMYVKAQSYVVLFINNSDLLFAKSANEK